MAKAKVVVTADLPDIVTEELKQKFDARWLSLQHLGQAAFVEQLCDTHAVVVIPGDPIDAQFFEILPPSVKLIASYSVGVDHIDVEAAAKANVNVSNTPDVLTDATADIALMLIIGAIRGAGDGARIVRDGKWAGWGPSTTFGFDLKGKTLGIFGFGRIGQAVAARAVPFGLNVIFHTRTAPTKQVPNTTFEPDWTKFLQSIDILSLHAPATPQTENIINKETLSLMRPGVVIVNTARGDLIDDDALIAAVKTGHVGAIGLDVFRGEPNLDKRYLTLDHTMLLPHIGSGTIETRAAMGRKVIANIEASFESRPLPDKV